MCITNTSCLLTIALSWAVSFSPSRTRHHGITQCHLALPPSLQTRIAKCGEAYYLAHIKHSEVEQLTQSHMAKKIEQTCESKWSDCGACALSHNTVEVGKCSMHKRKRGFGTLRGMKDWSGIAG